MGRSIPALLFRTTVNLEGYGPEREEHLSSGRYVLADMQCRGCCTPLGWRYISAHNEVCTACPALCSASSLTLSWSNTKHAMSAVFWLTNDCLMACMRYITLSPRGNQAFSEAWQHLCDAYSDSSKTAASYRANNQDACSQAGWSLQAQKYKEGGTLIQKSHLRRSADDDTAAAISPASTPPRRRLVA